MSVSVKGLQVRLDEEGSLMFLSEWSMESDVMGYHAYKDEWIAEIGETLSTRREPENMEDRYAVCVLKSNAIVGHLKKGQSGRYAKTVFYFLRSDPNSSCTMKVRRRAINLGNGKASSMTLTCIGQTWFSKNIIFCKLRIYRTFAISNKNFDPLRVRYSERQLYQCTNRI